MQFVWNLFGQLIPRESTTVCNSYDEKRDLICRSEHRPMMASGPQLKGAYQSSEFIAQEIDAIPVPIEDAVYDVLKQSNCLSEIIKAKFDCDAFLMSAHSSPLPAQKVYEKTLGRTDKVLLSVWMDDLTQHNVDVVVNAANEDLAHVGGLALAILTAGGEEIQRESQSIIEKERKIQTGQVVVTSSGKLPCKYVLHAVGPDCSRQAHAHEKCKALLKEAITNILDFVINKLGVRSVAIPALSSGIYSFPLKECADIIVQKIKEFNEMGQFGKTLKEIHLVNNDQQTVSAIKKACEDILESSSPDPSRGHSEKILSSKSAISVTVRNVCLELLKGRIEEQGTTIIVNSINESRKLSEGFISSSILKKAGDRLQHEIEKKNPSLVMKTSGHNLQCQFIYHVTVPHAQTTGAEKKFRQAVAKCLVDASQDGHTSISFPAIGTGTLGFGKKRVANIMISEVIHFAKQYSGIGLHVQFVIYPQDGDSLKVFADELQSQRAQIKTSGYMSNMPNDFVFNSEKPNLMPKKPTIRIGGRDSCHIEEAVKWIQATMQPYNKSLLIENNHIFYFGAQEHEALVQKLDSSVSIIENLKNGRAHFTITGPGLHIIKAALEIEKMLCVVQKQYETTEMNEHRLLADLLVNEPGSKKGKIPSPDICDLKRSIETSDKLYQDKSKEFEKAGLVLVKMEQIQNPLLKIIHQSKRDSIEAKRNQHVISTLYHQVPSQFCNLVCKIGFQRIYSNSQDQRYGAGIYFYKSVKILQANSKQKLTEEKYIYIFQAEVVTGIFTKGKESYIVPPPVGGDKMDLFDSVVDEGPFPETFVIFNSSQAIPQYLYTCAKKHQI